MQFTWRLLFIVAAFICFVLAAFSVPSPPRINLTAAGLALLTAGFFFIQVLRHVCRSAVRSG